MNVKMAQNATVPKKKLFVFFILPLFSYQLPKMFLMPSFWNYPVNVSHWSKVKVGPVTLSGEVKFNSLKANTSSLIQHFPL